MVFFFALAAKEVFEATLPGGALASGRQAVSPLMAAVGGMAAPAAIYALLTLTVGPSDLLRGWAIPCATDIAFSAMRSEEHTSELQSPCNLVCRLLLEKKKE